MKIHRLFEIVYLLMNKKSMTASALATHFEVSRRTILRDIDALSAAGIPVYTLQGKGGGISIQDRFILNKVVISENEQQQILFALQGMAATRHFEADGVLGRLRSLFEKTGRRDWIEVDFSRWGNHASDREKFDALKNAVINEQAISFTYSNTSGETTEREAYPLKLAFKSQSWYVQAFCLLRNDYRTFKISRMRNVAALPAAFDSQAYQPPEVDSPDDRPPDYPGYANVKLRFSPQAAYRVFDEFNERDIVVEEGGTLSVTMEMPLDYRLYDFVFSLGALVEVVEPQGVRDEIARQAERIRDMYAK